MAYDAVKMKDWQISEAAAAGARYSDAAEGSTQTSYSRSMAKTSTVVNIIIAKTDPNKLLK